ncbi:MAG: low molecular weight phosphotyrosine protein phosphatase [Ignavibacteriaceae bacterium]|nr:low molecular weight phosphotyrosine protein phosphatase [Ignavibacteriaceae bacterium]
MIKVLFVCLGNICRSPVGEAIFQKLVNDKGLNSKISVDSAGMAGYHIGELADSRMRKHALKRGYEITHRARKIRSEDFFEFDYILIMDQNNYHDYLRLDPGKVYRDKVFFATDFAKNRKEKEVPDPYYGGPEGFEHVIDIMEDVALGLLRDIKEKHDIG